jgi:hypothetical protein
MCLSYTWWHTRETTVESEDKMNEVYQKQFYLTLFFTEFKSLTKMHGQGVGPHNRAPPQAATTIVAIIILDIFSQKHGE